MSDDKPEEQIGALYERCYRGSPKVSLSAYFSNYKSLLESSPFRKHHEAEARSFLVGAMTDDVVDEEKFSMLEDHCSVTKLSVPGELGKVSKAVFDWYKDPEEPSVLDDVDLLTVQHTRQRNLLKNYQVLSKYRSDKPVIYKPVPVESKSVMLLPENDVIVYVRVYVPFTGRFKVSSGALGKLSVSSTIAILGSQTLDKLRDIISCESDYSISVEMSEAPTKYKTDNAKNVYKSGFFFIENTFYNDYRDPSNKDNSKVIREWAELKKLGTFNVAKMEETRVDSLKLKFGFPWVYQHQGDCEHLISFSDARLVNKSDELNASCYPRIVRIKPRPNRYCMTCGLYNVSWIITSNDRLPHNPCLFCESCFKSYNYVKGKKIGNFAAYPYPFDNDLVQPHLKIPTKRKLGSTRFLMKKQNNSIKQNCNE